MMTRFRSTVLLGWLAALAVLAGAGPAGAEAVWVPLGGGLSGGVVRYLHIWDGKLVAAGEFSMAGGQAANNIAIWDGVRWAPLGRGWAWVGGVVTYAGQLCVKGRQPDSTSAEIAVWDGTAWTTLLKTIYANFASYDGKLYGSRSGYSAVNPWDGYYWAELLEFDGVDWGSALLLSARLNSNIIIFYRHVDGC